MILILIMIIIVSLILVVLLSYYMAKTAVQPILDIISVIDHPEEWVDLKKLTNKKVFEEFGYIASNIISSFNNLAELKDELRQKFVLLKKAQETALQAQIQPHFIFNTLETINLMALKLTKSENEVSKMICTLSDLLRLSFKTKSNMIDISDEIAHARKYIEIQKIRYEDKFNVSFDVNPQVNQYKTAKLVLQPMIENAIYHGIKPSYKIGEIHITVDIEDNLIIFTVSDNGVGISPEKLMVITSSFDSDDIHNNEGIGLFNVNQRIKLIFGEPYGIKIDSYENLGTTITLTIPAVK